MLNHTALLNRRRADWGIGGYSVDIEGQNSFQLRGTAATLAGKPDLIARRDGEAVSVDMKTRQEIGSHIRQFSYSYPSKLPINKLG